MDALATAAGVVDIANLEMLRATTAVTVARGIDPRDHALIAFGGAGPMHAAAIAEALEIDRVICPAACGVLSAWGISVAGRRRDRSRSLVQPLEQLDEDDLAMLESALESSAAADLGIESTAHETAAVYELRYSGQAFELPVSADRALLGDAFHAAHEERFGFAEPGADVELVTVRVSVATPPAESRVPEGVPGTGAERATRTTWFAGARFEATVVRDGPAPGRSVDGPAIIEQSQTTIVVPPGWTASSAGADVVLDRRKAGAE
jgi:N-methylhydantoinase A